MSNKTSTNIRSQTEVLSNNIVDKNVQSIFLPFTIMHTILLSPKYRIKNNIITPNNNFNKLLLLCGTFISVFVYSYRVYEILLFYYIEVFFYMYCVYCDFFYQIFGFVLNLIVNLVHTKTSVAFVLNIQEIHRFVNNEYDSKIFIRNSWISIIFSICFYFISCVAHYIINPNVPIHHVISFVTVLYYDSNIMFAIRFIKLLQNKTKQWNFMVIHSFNDIQNEICHQRLLETYFHILHSYQLYKNMFHQMILFYTVESFIYSLLVVQMFIELYNGSYKEKDQYTALSVTILYAIWMLKDLMLQIVLSLYLEAFYIAMEDSQDTCTHILLSSCTDEDKKLYKNVRRVYRASFSKMRACRLFYVDVCLLLHLAVLLTHYTVVLLQFAFL